MKRTCVLTVLVSLLSVTLRSVSAAEDPVVFGDSEVKDAVEEELGVSDPTPSDMLELRELSIVTMSISSITGIEYALNLKSFRLSPVRLRLSLF